MFFAFIREIKQILEKGKTKGYSCPDAGEPGGTTLRFLYEHFGDAHALGEITLKAVRFRAKKDPEDLVKIATWAYLAWTKAAPLNRGLQFDPTAVTEEEIENLKAGAGMAVGSMGLAQGVGSQIVNNSTSFVHITDALESRAMRAYAERPKVRTADMVRLTALVSEEAGEATKAALDYTRDLEDRTHTLRTDARKKMLACIQKEIEDTAVMAIIALKVMEDQGYAGN